MKTHLSRHLLVQTAAVLVLSLSTARPLIADDVKTDNDDLKALTAEVEEAIRLETAERLNHYTLLYSTRVAQTDSLIGISAAEVDDVLRSHLGLAEGKGVLVTEVADESPAKQAGIQKNDVLVAVGDQEIVGVEGLNKLLEAAAEKATAIGLISSGRRKTVVATPKPAAAALRHRARVILNETERRYWLGVGLATADDTLRSHLGIASVEGLVVTGVEENSPAAKAGVMINDVLLKVDGKPVTTVEALAAQLQEIGSKSANLELLRRGKPATLTVTPERRPAEHVLLFSAIDRGEDAVKLEHQLGEWLTTRLVLNRDLVVEARLADQKSALEKQIGDLLEQARQLQKSLEALDSALKAQSAAPPAGK